MSEYVRKSEHQIDDLDDEGILDHISAARDAGDIEGAKQACGVLAFRYLPQVRARVYELTPAASVDDVVMDVMESAVRSAFDGRFAGEFSNWLKTITRRRIADFHERRKRQPQQSILPDEHQDEDGVWVRQGIADLEFQQIALRELAEEVIRQRKSEIHRAVIRLYGYEVLGFEELDAATTVTEIEKVYGERLKEPNVHQIWRRFTIDFRSAWEDADEAGGEAA